MSALYNSIRMTVSGTPGTGVVTLLAAVSNLFYTFAEAGVPNGKSDLSIRFEDGTDFQLTKCTYSSTGPTLTINSVIGSKIAGVAGTTQLSLTSAAICYIDALAADIAGDIRPLVFRDITNQNITYTLKADSISADDRLIITSDGTSYGTRVWYDTPSGGSPAFSLAENGVEKFAFGGIGGGNYGVTVYSGVDFVIRDALLDDFVVFDQSQKSLVVQSIGMFQWTSGGTGDPVDTALRRDAGGRVKVTDGAGALAEFKSQALFSYSLSSSSTELMMEQTGDTYGATRLRLQNRFGSNGAVFENDTLDLVDFAFKGSGGVSRSVRFEHRAHSGGNGVLYSANTDGEIQFGESIDNTTFWMVVGQFTVGIKGQLNVGGTINAGGKISAAIDSAATNTVTYAERLTSTSTGTAANGIGVGMEFEVETANGNNEIGATIEAVVTDVTPGSEDFDMVVKIMAAGAPVVEALRISSSWEYLGVPKTLSKDFIVRTDYQHTVQERLTMAGSRRATLQGTANLILTDDMKSRSRIVLAGRG